MRIVSMFRIMSAARSCAGVSLSERSCGSRTWKSVPGQANRKCSFCSTTRLSGIAAILVLTNFNHNVKELKLARIVVCVGRRTIVAGVRIRVIDLVLSTVAAVDLLERHRTKPLSLAGLPEKPVRDRLELGLD